MNDVKGPTRIRDGYHVHQLNVERYIDIHKTILPELYPDEFLNQDVQERNTDGVFFNRPRFDQDRIREIAPDHAEWVVTRRTPSKTLTERALERALSKPGLSCRRPERPRVKKQRTGRFQSLIPSIERKIAVHEARISTNTKEEKEEKGKNLRDKINQMRLAPERAAIIQEKEKRLHKRAVAHYSVNQIRQNRLTCTGPDAFQSMKEREVRQFQRQKERRTTAMLRKHNLDQQEKIRIAQSVDRWDRRRQECEREAQHIDRIKLWMSSLVLSEAGRYWEHQYAIFHTALVLRRRGSAAAKIQKQFKAKHPALSIAVSPIHVLKRFILRSQTRHKNRQAAIILQFLHSLAGFKFKRIVYKSVHKVYLCQNIWRGYHYITNSRMKGLMLLWKRVERERHAEIMILVQEQELKVQAESTSPRKAAGRWKKALEHSKIEEKTKKFMTLEQKLVAHLRAAISKSGAKHPTPTMKHRLLRNLLIQRRRAFMLEYEQYRAALIAWQKSQNYRRRQANPMPLPPFFSLYSQITTHDMEQIIVQGYLEARSI